jgi:hypothetical protein
MFQRKIIFCLVLLVVQHIESSSMTENVLAKYWLTSCSQNGCNLILNSCMICLGQTSCRNCISTLKPECSTCANDIFDPRFLESVPGLLEPKLICDPVDQFQRQVCTIYCRGKFFNSGNCQYYGAIPVCNCS